MTSRMRSRFGWLLALLAVMAVSAGCSGVPRQSRPDPVRTVGVDVSATPGAYDGPQPSDDPRTIVVDFLHASLNSDARHSSARQFLTTNAGGKWNDSVVTIANDYKVDVAQAHGDVATVGFSYQRIGSIDANGIFSPEKTGLGIGPTNTGQFQLRRVNKIWRLDQLPFAGLLIERSDFGVNYTAHPLYFFNSTESQLIPDLRYSALDNQSLASWLLARMLGGPRPELVQSVQTEIPDGTDLTRAGVSFGDPIQVEIPGSARFDAGAQVRLATELAYTLGPIRYAGRLTLTDGGKPVNIPNVGTIFSTSDFPGLGADNVTPTALPYFLRGGGLVSGTDDKAVPGPVGAGAYGLSSVALRRTSGNAPLVAGVSSSGALYVGPANGQLTRITGLPAGQPSPPEFQPGTSDVWIAVGTSIFRIGADRKPVPIPTPPALGGGLPVKGQIEVLRFSPDGVRLAVVFRTADASSNALWVGTEVRSGQSLSMEAFEAITPTALTVSDVSWKDATTLLAIAAGPGEEPQIYTVKSDGASLLTVASSGLPSGLSNVAAAVGQEAVVSTQNPGGSVWVQTVSGWSSLSGGGQTDGYAPTYAQ